jgi:hypothetical protein
MKKFVLALVFGFATLGVTPVFAEGTFDFLDPCIKARSDYADQRQQVREKIAAANDSVDAMTYTPDFKDEWIKAKREQARPIFDTQVAPVLARYNVTDMDAAFAAWFSDILASTPTAELDSLINATYRHVVNEEIARLQAKSDAEFDKVKNELDNSCKMDVGNQVLRVALPAILAPITTVVRNLEIAKNESGVGAQILAGTTGISVDAIEENGGVLGGGLSGGEGSFFRKNLGIRF